MPSALLRPCQARRANGSHTGCPMPQPLRRRQAYRARHQPGTPQLTSVAVPRVIAAVMVFEKGTEPSRNRPVLAAGDTVGETLHDMSAERGKDAGRRMNAQLRSKPVGGGTCGTDDGGDRKSPSLLMIPLDQALDQLPRPISASFPGILPAKPAEQQPDGAQEQILRIELRKHCPDEADRRLEKWT